MSGTSNRKLEKLRDKRYRDAYVASNIRIGIPYQIRALREQKDRNWSQGELGKRAGKPRNVISRLENPEYGQLTIRTLLELASAFDVALLVKYVSYSRFLREFEDVSPQALEVASFTNDPEITGMIQCERGKSLSNVVNTTAKIEDVPGHVWFSGPDYQIDLDTSPKTTYLQAPVDVQEKSRAGTGVVPRVEKVYFVDSLGSHELNILAREPETSAEPAWTTIGQDYSEPDLTAAHKTS